MQRIELAKLIILVNEWEKLYRRKASPAELDVLTATLAEAVKAAGKIASVTLWSFKWFTSLFSSQVLFCRRECPMTVRLR